MPDVLRRAGAVLRRGGRAARRPAPVVLRPAAAGALGDAGGLADVPLLLLYLALLFVAMGIDRALPFGHRPAPTKVIILEQAGARPGHSRRRRTSPIDRGREQRMTDTLAELRPAPASAARPAGPPLAPGAARIAACCCWPRLALVRQRALGPRLSDGGALPARRRVREARPGAARPHRARPGGALQRAGGAQLRPGLSAERGRRAVGGRAPARALRPAARDAARLLRRAAHRRAHQPAHGGHRPAAERPEPSGLRVLPPGPLAGRRRRAAHLPAAPAHAHRARRGAAGGGLGAGLRPPAPAA